MSWERNLLRTMQGNCCKMRKQIKLIGKSIMSVFSMSSSLETHKTCQTNAQLKAQASRSPKRWSQRPSARWLLAKQPDHQVLSLRCWSLLVKPGLLRCVILLSTLSQRDVSQLTGRRATLLACTRAKGILWTGQQQGLEIDWASIECVGACSGASHQAKSWDRWDAVWLHVRTWHYWCNIHHTSATGEALDC